MKEHINFAALETSGATDVVCGITRESQALVTVRMTSTDRNDSHKLQTGLSLNAAKGSENIKQIFLNRTVANIGKIDLDGRLVLDQQIETMITTLDFSISGDGINNIGRAPTSFEEALEFLGKVSSSLKAFSRRRGNPALL